ncbi:MAG: hypothetical protein EAX96_18300 [Candidatus Lokiarchaeota archaeon]|nr:hypothetical protein [Candidatus Lokiarchaeota archaeon]
MTKTKKRRTSTKRKGSSKTHELTTAVKVIAVIGCILIILTSIFQILGALGFASFPLYNVGILQGLGVVIYEVVLIIFAIINIILALLLLAGFGIIDWDKYLAANFIILLVIGIVTILLGSVLGGACLIIAAILDIIGLLLR